MSTSWNGKPMCSHNDTAASRCMGIIERGIQRLRLERAPAQFNQMLVARDAVTTRKAVVVRDRDAEMRAIVAAWHKLPLAKRTLHHLAFTLRLSDDTVRAALAAAGIDRAEYAKISAARREEIAEKRRNKILAAWHAVPAAQRKLDTLAKAAGVRDGIVSEVLAAAGLKPSRGQKALRAKAACGNVSTAGKASA